MASAIGGQAVLEGVMMRGPRNWAVAVRKPDGEIAHVARVVDPLMARNWTLRLPIVRGIVALGESLSIGFRALSVSASYAAAEEAEGDGEPAEIGRWALFFSFAVAIGFAVMLFKVSPALLTDLLPISSGGWFVIVEGVIRVTIFVAYLGILSLIPSLRRVFQYHAAEHKAINAYEAGDELTPENAQRHSLIHPRCGTAFLLWVMVIGVFVFALFGRPAWYWLIVTPDRLPAADRRARLRADPLRRQARRQQVADDAALAGAVAPAADDARADARPARGVHPCAEGSPRARGPAGPGRRACGGDGVMATTRTAAVVWNGGLLDGSGTIVSNTSGALPQLPVTWASRSEEPNGKTSPEELIAAAHASCFAMALSFGLADAGTPPTELRTSASVTFQPGEGITGIALTVRGVVPGLDADGFAAAAEGAKANCPVSKALAAVPISLDAALAD